MIHVALLRGINAGGRNKLAMAKLRQVAEGCGFEGVSTHVQSGNAVLRSSQPSGGAVAARLREALREATGLDVPVMVRTRSELAAVVAGNPFPDRVRDPTRVHVVFWEQALRKDPLAGLELGSYAPEEARTLCGHLYLHLPGGIGRSRLAADLARRDGPAGTVRNWRTVTKLLEIADELWGAFAAGHGPAMRPHPAPGRLDREGAESRRRPAG
jgi:uncharacterized protein (DUF1697 family)